MTADVLFPVIFAICLAKCNACVVLIFFDVGALDHRDLVHQEPLGRHYRLWVIQLPRDEVVCQIDLETLILNVVRQQDK